MTSALVLLADGFEEIEAVTIVDVLRRADVKVTTASLTTKSVIGSHGIAIEADRLLDELLSSTPPVTFDLLALPGGLPGSKHLRDDARVMDLVRQQAAASRIVAAICAAPIALEAAGVLRGKFATSYPGNELASASYREERVVTDGNIITSRGPGTALEFALTLVEQLVSVDRAKQLRAGMIVAA
jgi:protein deglycase